MLISQMAPHLTAHCPKFGTSCNATCLQAPTSAIKVPLKERLAEPCMIAVSRTQIESTGALCDLTLALLVNPIS
ncbi:MAG: hypothetical protein HY785_14270 [Oscillatoriophycideae cyanobacterium NC_groundwater_1537_Pr4_S-0.65um_50_18]|nr:hypothetical protein [Oscillatoriophycideae cyanobacterium NC_groundwater_1537_Pr4_S-0.65um_50_18]